MQRLVADILTAWRSAERLTNELPPGTPEHRAVEKARTELRDLYREMTASAIAQSRSEANAARLPAEVGADLAET